MISFSWNQNFSYQSFAKFTKFGSFDYCHYSLYSLGTLLVVDNFIVSFQSLRLKEGYFDYSITLFTNYFAIAHYEALRVAITFTVINAWD